MRPQTSPGMHVMERLTSVSVVFIRRVNSLVEVKSSEKIQRIEGKQFLLLANLKSKALFQG